MTSKPKDRRPLRRHDDDDYWDRVTVQATTGANLIGFVVPRYKTSGLSGDEWRVGARMEVRRRHPDSKPVFERGFSRIHGLTAHAGLFVLRHTPELLSSPQATLVVERKGHALMTETFPTFGEAVVGMQWHIVTCNEGREGVEWHHISDAEEATHCQQVGCAEPPVNTFRYRKLFYSKSDPERTFLPPKYDFEGQWTWYCARHTQRGDAGYEDADKNLELVGGPGVARPRGGDFSPSGLVVLGDEGDDG